METARTTTLDDVRLAILRQHTQLRQLLDEVELHAKAVLTGGGDGTKLEAGLGLLHTRFTKHLEYEETHLAPWANRGPMPLLGDHEEQRERMDGLLHDRSVFGDPRTLAREACAFVHLLSKEMQDEETALRELR
jgi:hypothetical protein